MDEKIKVTDKRMFTSEGELRQTEPEAGEEAAADRPTPQPPEGAPTTPAESGPKTEAEGAGAVRPKASDGPSAYVPDVPDVPKEPARSGLGTRKGDFPAPTFIDLIGLLAQPIAMFLGDAQLPGGEAEENLPLARFHIDLLELVESKTQGNINAEEAKLLEDLLYQLRMRYLQKAG